MKYGKNQVYIPDGVGKIKKENGVEWQLLKNNTIVLDFPILFTLINKIDT
jgi:hypothetical protein